MAPAMRIWIWIWMGTTCLPLGGLLGHDQSVHDLIGFLERARHRREGLTSGRWRGRGADFQTQCRSGWLEDHIGRPEFPCPFYKWGNFRDALSFQRCQ